MRRKFLLFFFYVCFSIVFSTSGQNLVTNGDFETYSTLPTNYGDFCLVTGWINPSACCSLNPNYGTPDFIHKNAAWPVSSPNSGFGMINPRSGNSTVGFTSYANYGTPPVFREYVSKKFSSHMITGQSYSVSFYIIRASSPYFKYATNRIGVYFSTLPAVQTNTTVINVIPQWEYPSVFSGTTWTLMSFNLIATDTFNYITIGNFRSDALTVITNVTPSAAGLYSHYFLDDVSVIPAIPLPIELLSFEARSETGVIQLKWATASEFNNDYFTIERSRDLKVFEDVKTVEAVHNSLSYNSYSAVDESPFSGNSYYRLRQTDFNGSFGYSEVVKVSMDQYASAAAAWYDGLNQKLHVDIPRNSPGNVSILLYDMAGKQCHYQKPGHSGKVLINTEALRKGIYTLRMQDDLQVFVKKLMIY